jgi:hypothetical protein
MINNGMNLAFDLESMELIYNQENFGPITEKRKLKMSVQPCATLQPMVPRSSIASPWMSD